MLPNELAHFEDVLDWRSQSRQRAAAQTACLVTLSDDDLSTALTNIPDGDLLCVLEDLLDAANEALDKEPPRACYYTSLVLMHVSRVAVPPGAEPLIDLLRAQAWKERANALHTTGDLPGALIATQRGIGALGANPAYGLERADIEMLEAHIHHNQGDGETALARIRGCAAQFRAAGDVRRSLRARTKEGGLLYEMRRYVEAENAFRDAYADAKRANDRETMVRLENNFGHCAVQRGDYVAANAHFATALTGFDSLGMEAERQRALWGLASVLAKSGQVSEAIGQLNTVQAEFLGRGMFIDAALVALAIVELLVTVDRLALFPGVCRNLVLTFANAGMSANALTAFAYLEGCAQAGSVTAKEIERVRTFVHALAGEPNAIFAA
jgi:tetratricopeptide (TPR) repeat protein